MQMFCLQTFVVSQAFKGLRYMVIGKNSNKDYCKLTSAKDCPEAGLEYHLYEKPPFTIFAAVNE